MLFLHAGEHSPKMSVEGPLTIHRRKRKYLTRLMYLPNYGTFECHLLLFKRSWYTLELEVAQQVHFVGASDKLAVFEIIEFPVF